MSKKTRDEAMSEMFDKTYGKPAERQPKNAPIEGVPMSMGCRVPELVCSICAEDEPHVHFSSLMSREGVPFEPFYRGSFDSFSVSMVPAPKCEGCGVEMSRHDSTNWECREATCPEHGKPVSAHLSGVYPFEIVSEPGR